MTMSLGLHPPPPLPSRGFKNFRKVFAGKVRNFYLGWELYCWGELIQNCIIPVKKLIYFWDIWKIHLLSSEKYIFQWNCCFSSKPFLKQLASHASAKPFSWKSQVWSFFSSILGIGTFFLEGFKVFCVVLMRDKSSHIKNRKAWW